MSGFVASRLLCGLALCLCLTSLPFSAGAAPSEAAILRAPQNMEPFAEAAGRDRLLMPPEEQAERDRRSNQLFFSPWSQARPSLNAARFRDQLPRKPRGYNLDVPWSAEAWQALHHNIRAEAYPSPLGPAVITRHTDLRAMPTDAPQFMEPTPVPAQDFFDFFQYASLPLGTPVYVSHVSRDGQWLYLEYPLLSGWTRARDVALVSRSFARAYATGRYAVAVRDHVVLNDKEGTALGTTHMGSVFPFGGEDPDSVWVPVRAASGEARMASVRPPQGALQPKPLPLTPGRLAELGNRMLGQPYAWGGSGENRDCSLAMRDLFLPFGIWLPRNSRGQAGGDIQLASLSPAARKARILKDAKPFITLLGFVGHVGLYVGTHEGEPVFLHTILGLRTNNEEEFYRHIIGKCILSVLEPGADIPEVQIEQTLLERMLSMRRLYKGDAGSVR